MKNYCILWYHGSLSHKTGIPKILKISNEISTNLITPLINLHASHTVIILICPYFSFQNAILMYSFLSIPWIPTFHQFISCPPFLVNLALSSFEHTQTLFLSLLLVSFHPFQHSCISWIFWFPTDPQAPSSPIPQIFLLPACLSIQNYCCAKLTHSYTNEKNTNTTFC